MTRLAIKLEPVARLAHRLLHSPRAVEAIKQLIADDEARHAE